MKIRDLIEQILNGIYADMTGLIDYMNSTIDTTDQMKWFCRPGRLGKSFAAKMLCAYLGSVFFEKYLNRINTIYPDITRCISLAAICQKNVLTVIQSGITGDLREAYIGLEVKIL